MKIYLVGGAVRDALLKRTVTEKDYVVVGSTVDAMLAKGFKPVGKSFPVFLHPHTHEEYALARTEKKVGLGYHGFAFFADPSVTLEQDLARRDLTINAIAQDESGNLTDPFNGIDDIHNRILRHVSPAFVEDPVRLLRIARFLARFKNLGFTIAPETMILLKEMVVRGETKALVAERVWQECEKALNENSPEAFFETLHETGALFDVLELPKDFDFAKGMERVQKLTPRIQNRSLRLAGFLSPATDKVKWVLEKLKAPKQDLQRAQQLFQFAPDIVNRSWMPASILKLIKSHPKIVDADYLAEFLNACYVVMDKIPADIQKTESMLLKIEAEIGKIKADAFVQQGLSGTELGKAIEHAWLEKITQILASS